MKIILTVCVYLQKLCMCLAAYSYFSTVNCAWLLIVLFSILLLLTISFFRIRFLFSIAQSAWFKFIMWAGTFRLQNKILLKDMYKYTKLNHFLLSYLYTIFHTGSRSRGPWPLFNFKALYRNSIFATENPLSL